MADQNPITARVEAAVAHANEYASQCATLLASHGLRTALDHCRSLGIEPPTCSLTAMSPNAERMRAQAEQKLVDSRWWSRRLRVKAIQDFEMEQTRQGKVTDFVSDELLSYHTASKRSA